MVRVPKTRPQIRKWRIFEHFMFANSIEKQAWDSFKGVVNWFLVNNRADNYQDLIAIMLESYTTSSSGPI